MRSLFSLAVIVLALVLAVGPALAGEVTGKVQKVDTDQKMVTLEDGTQLWLAEGTKADNVKEGAKVKVSYDEKDGKNWATSFEILPE
jgi:Cu/Ag efflux protein CusF